MILSQFRLWFSRKVPLTKSLIILYMYSYFIHSQKYSLLSVFLSGSLYTDCSTGLKENCRKSNVSELQGCSSISHNFQTSDINYIFSDPRKHKQMSLPTRYKLSVVCTKATLICPSPQVRNCFPLPRVNCQVCIKCQHYLTFLMQKVAFTFQTVLFLSSSERKK